MFIPCPRKVEDSVVHVTGGKAEFFDGIVHQHLERIVHRGLAYFGGHVFILIDARRPGAVVQVHLVAILLLLRLHLLPLPLHLENLQNSVDRLVIGGRERQPIKEREGLLQSASKAVVLGLKT